MRFSSSITAGLVLLVGVSCARTFDDKAVADASPVVDSAPIDVGPPSDCDVEYGGFAGARLVAAKHVERLKNDCRIQQYFSAIPAARLAHVEECLAMQVAAILHCTKSGQRVKYPGPDSKGLLCRDMKSSHAGNGISGGDFAAWVEDLRLAFADAKFDGDDAERVIGVFSVGVNQKDIVESSAQTPSKAVAGCDAGPVDATAPDVGDGGYPPPY